MKINNFVSINSGYTRSINVERDNASQGVLEAYIPTSRAISTLERIATTLTNTAIPRAWALIGPYGSGKSAFSLFLSHLLEGQQSQLNDVAREKLANHAPQLEAVIRGRVSRKGYLHILVSGSPEPLARRLLLTAQQTLAKSNGLNKKTKSALQDQLANHLAMEQIASSDVLQFFGLLQEALEASGFDGLLLVIDELGKFLEYEARNPRANDIHLLQLLAEHSAKASPAPLQLIVLMHQAFELYARNVRETLKNEWQKVQGRFETISFIEAAEQSMRILASVIEQKLPQQVRQAVTREASRIATVLNEQGALPGTLTQSDAAALFAGCYPLHPLSLLILPVLCQKVAQNERTLFSYLGSAEPFGFAESMAALSCDETQIDWIQPWHIYDYFIHNQPASLADSSTQRRWMEVASALDRLGGESSQEEALLKTIGLLNIIGAQGGLKPSEAVLSTIQLPANGSKKASAQNTAQALMGKSLITYRKFNGEYRVWQGSDFDFDEALRNALSEGGRVDLIAKLNQHGKAAPIVARRYTIETGTLRYFLPAFTTLEKLTQLPASQQAQLVYVLVGQFADLEESRDFISAESKLNPTRLFAMVPYTEDLASSIAEVEALRQIQQRNPLLANDPIARRELRERIRQASHLEEVLLTNLIDDPGVLEWHWRGNMFSLTGRRSLQEKLSKLLANDLYPSAPHIHNELINREKPSATANAAKKKLLVAMLDKAEHQDLGFDKFPAEKAIYLALLKATGIHRFEPSRGRWIFADPLPEFENRYRMSKAWHHIVDFFRRAEKQPVTVKVLFEELAASPFGIKDGVMPILFLAAYLAHEQEVAVFDQGAFSGTFTLEMLEKLLKDPGQISIQNASLSGVRLALFHKYSEVLLQGRAIGDTFLPIAKQIAKLMRDLPEYTQKTKRISEEAAAVRALFMKADSPGALLFQVLPTACGFNPDDLNTPEAAENYVKKLLEVLKELSRAYQIVLSELAARIRSAFGYASTTNLHDLRNALRGRALGLANYTADAEGLKAFVLRLEEQHGDDELWLERLASLLTKKPATKWNDADLQVAELRLLDLVASFNNLEQLRIEHGHASATEDSEFEVMLVHTMRPQAPERKEFVRIRKARLMAMSSSKAQIHELLSAYGEEDRLALLASLLEETMSKGQYALTNLNKESSHD